MVLPMSGDRVNPVVMTPYPCTSSHCLRFSICDERPTPSVPSMTINFPLMSERSRYGTSMLRNLEPSLGDVIDLLSLGESRVVIAEFFSNNFPDNVLLFLDGKCRIHDGEFVFRGDLVVLLQDVRLEDAEAFTRIVAKAQ